MNDPMDGVREIENTSERILRKDSDSRLQGTLRPKVTTQDGKFERTYCFLCGKPFGWVSTDTSLTASPSHIVVSCDQCDADIITKMSNGDITKFPLKPVPEWLLEAFGMVPENKVAGS